MSKDPEFAPWLDSYWFALGKFVHRYAELEAAMHSTLRSSIGLDVWDAQALFSGTRIRASVDLIKRVHEGRGMTLSPWLDKAFGKVGEITTARDRILHYGFDLDGKKATVTDFERNLPSKSFRMNLTVDNLDDLETDTITCIACLTYDWFRTNAPWHNPRVLERETELASRPWRFTLPPPLRARRTEAG